MDERPEPSPEPASPHTGPGGTRRSRAKAFAVGALAVLLFLLLVDVAVETFLSGSPLRWIVGGAIAAYIALSILLYRRLTWAVRAILSLFVLLALLAVTAWLPEGLSHGAAAVRQSTSLLLTAITALAILVAAVIVVRAKYIPPMVRGAFGLLAMYSVAALVLGVIAGIPFPELFQGRSFWDRLPYWLQGAFVGALILIPVVLLFQIGYGLLRVRGIRLRQWSVEVLVLSMAVVIAAAGLVAPGFPGPGAERVPPAQPAQPSTPAQPPSPAPAPPPLTPPPPDTATQPPETPESGAPPVTPPPQPAAESPSGGQAAEPAAPAPDQPQPAPPVVSPPPPAPEATPAPPAITPVALPAPLPNGSIVRGSFFFTTYAGCTPGSSTDVNRVAFRYVVGTKFTLDTPKGIACLKGADGLIVTPDGDLLVGGQGDVVHKVNPKTGTFTSATAGGVSAYHMMMDPNQRQAWASGIPGTPASIPLNPFGNGTAHRLTGTDTSITTIAWDDTAAAYYTSSGSGGEGTFGRIDLTTFQTTRVFAGLAAAHGMTYDPLTHTLILFGDSHIIQIAPGKSPAIVSDLALSGFQFDQGTVDGNGHLFAASNSGHLVFLDYSATGKVADPKNFKAVVMLAASLDDVAPLVGPGAMTQEAAPEIGEVLVRFAPEAQATNRNVEIIFDASGSMNRALGNDTRLAVAKRVLADLVKHLPSDVRVALRVFGHRKAGRASCTDTELMVPIGSVSRQAIAAKVNALRALGDTPLVANLLLAAQDLASAKAATVVAITDGQETCGGDVRTVAQRLRASGVQLVVNIVGFALADRRAIAEWTLVAESTGGRYFPAGNADQLGAALREAARLEYAAYDSTGRVVGKMQVGKPLRLPAGTYTLVVRASRPVMVKGVKVGPAASAVFILRRSPTGWTLKRE